MLDQAGAVKLVDAYLKAVAAIDLDALADMFAENATLEDPVGTEVRRGTAAIREFYAGLKGASIEARLLGSVRCANNELVFPFAIVTDYSGVKNTIEVIDHFVVNDEGKIASMRAFWSEANISGSE